MKHEARAHHHEQEASLGRHVALGLVLVVQLLKDLVIVVDILVDGLGPAVELPVKGVELVVHELHTRHKAHHHLTLELDGALEVAGVHEAVHFLFDFFVRIVHREALGNRESLGLETTQLVNHVGLFTALVFRRQALGRSRQLNARARGRLAIVLGGGSEGPLLVDRNVGLPEGRRALRGQRNVKGHGLERLQRNARKGGGSRGRGSGRDVNGVCICVLGGARTLGIAQKAEPHVIAQDIVRPQVNYVPHVGGDANLRTRLRFGEYLHIMNRNGSTRVHIL